MKQQKYYTTTIPVDSSRNPEIEKTLSSQGLCIESHFDSRLVKTTAWLFGDTVVIHRDNGTLSLVAIDEQKVRDTAIALRLEVAEIFEQLPKPA